LFNVALSLTFYYNSLIFFSSTWALLSTTLHDIESKIIKLLLLFYLGWVLDNLVVLVYVCEWILSKN
jgi:hypothetical protein